MNPDEFVSITRGLVKRGWSEIEPKVSASFISGGASGILLAILTSYHVPITPALAQWLPYIIAVVGGYLWPSSGQVIVTKSAPDSHVTTTRTVGAVETIVTGAIPVQSRTAQAASPTEASGNWLASAVKNNPNNTGSTSDNATTVALPAATDAPQYTPPTYH